MDNFVDLRSLEKFIDDFNKQMYQERNIDPCFSGAIKGVQADCKRVSRHIYAGASKPPWIAARIDDLHQSQSQYPNYEVVVAVGINYGQSSSAKIPPIYDKTKMRPHLREGFDLMQKNVASQCLHDNPPSNEDYHLVAFNFFPWLTTNPWSALGLNGIEEALLIYCCGYSNFLDPLAKLIKNTKPKWVVFHGTNNAVPALGAAFCQTLNPDSCPDILFCDNLAWRVINNSVVLCRPSSRGVVNLANVDE